MLNATYTSTGTTDKTQNKSTINTGSIIYNNSYNKSLKGFTNSKLLASMMVNSAREVNYLQTHPHFFFFLSLI